MNPNEIGKQAADQAGGATKKVGSKLASKAVGKAGKYLKKQVEKFLKQLIKSLGKIITSVIGPWALVIIIVVLLTLAVLSAIPFADWFLGGNARSDDQKNADLQYEQEFKEAANETVAELWKVEADKTWISQVVKTVRPSWGIPASLVRYEILVNKKKVELSDYKPSDLIKNFKPSYSYTSIKDDKVRTKSITKCTKTTKNKDGSTSTSTTTSTSFSESNRPAHDVLSKITQSYASMDIKPLKRYYPGGTLQKTDQWDYSGTSTSGDCTTTSYKQYDHTTVDDRYVPDYVVDGPKFKQILIDLGVAEDDMKLFYEFIHTADPDWDPALYGGDPEDENLGDYGDYGNWLPGSAKVPDVVLRYEPIVRKYLKIKGLENQTQLVLALIMQESGGRSLDVMQSSESRNLPPGAITDPEISIEAGIEHFAKAYFAAHGDIPLTLQSYNFGLGFIDYARDHGGYSKANAANFSKMKAQEKGWKRYGDPNYVDHVLRYYNATDNIIKITPGQQIFDVQAVLNVMSQFLGQKYVWGGKGPSKGFDCSGLISYSFGQIGINLSGSAASQYEKTVPISPEEAKPGDLVFWQTYKKGPSHVGMYLGNGKFINSCSSLGVSYDRLSRWHNYPFLGYRRVVK